MAQERIFEDLLDHLHSELEHLEGQQKILLRERQNLIQRELEGIIDCVKQKETLQVQWRILKESGKILRERLSESLGYPEKDVNLGVVIDRTDGPVRSRLSTLKGRIENLVDEVERLNEGNRYLIHSALGHLSKSIAFLSQFQGSLAHTYNGEGRVMPNAPPPTRVQQQA